MSAGPWQLYDSFMLEKSSAVQNLDTDAFSVILMTSTYAPDLAVDSTYVGIIANEVADGFGYLAGGESVGTGLLTPTSGNINFSLIAAAWLATGDSIVTRYAVIINTTTGGLVGYSLLDITPGDITLTNTNTLTVDIPTNDVFNEVRT